MFKVKNTLKSSTRNSSARRPWFLRCLANLANSTDIGLPYMSRLNMTFDKSQHGELAGVCAI